jgi:signal transduction histidine kinase
VDISKVIDDVCHLLLSGSDKHGKPLLKDTVRLEQNYRALRQPRIECDAYRLTQVCTNIIGNALKFTEKGFVRVSTSLKGDTILIICDDTGKGIETSAQERIFEPFEQEDSSDTRSHGGIGLGLAISREIVRKLGGDITVVSTPGRGSTFTVALPLRQPEKPPEEPPVDLVSAVKEEMRRQEISQGGSAISPLTPESGRGTGFNGGTMHRYTAS